MNPSPLRTVLNIGALVAVLLVNWLANALPLNGKGTGQLSDPYPILTVPAGYTFAIWSLNIVLMLVLLGSLLEIYRQLRTCSTRS